jgi:hypothetical protein
VFTSTAYDETSIVVDRRVQVLQVTVQCAVFNVSATGLTILLFVARNCVTLVDKRVGSVGPVIMLNFFFLYQ